MSGIFYFRRVVVLLFVLASCKSVQVEDRTQIATSPGQLFPGLFEDVQSAGVFEDSKTFPDCVAKRPPQEILAAYQKEKGKPGFNLKEFVIENFDVPVTSAADYRSDTKAGLQKHISNLWDVLTRRPDVHAKYSSLIPLPYSYVVPGGRFREIYYWDSYFTMLGLEESGRADLIEGMVNNFAWLIRNYGFIPNGNRTYYLTRSQPPFFSLMVQLLMDNKGQKSDSVLLANTDALEKEYQFWMKTESRDSSSLHVVRLPGGDMLNRYFDRGNWPREEAYREDVKTAAKSGRDKAEVYRELRSGAESGWDFSSRWLEDGSTLETIRTTEIIPVDLNCLLYNHEIVLADAYKLKGEANAVSEFAAKAEKRRASIQKYFWDEGAGWYKDYDVESGRRLNQITLAGVFPLFFKIATQQQAATVASTLKASFLKPGGLVTTLNDTGQQWDAPNGWAPLQWISIAGLNNYNQQALAGEIASRWTSLNAKVFKQTGKLLEKYNVVDTTLTAGGGEYPTQDGFGWTNGVLLKLLNQYKIKDSQ